MNATNKKLDKDGFRRAKSARARHLSQRPPHGNGLPKNKKPYTKPLTSMGQQILCSLPPSPDHYGIPPTVPELLAETANVLASARERDAKCQLVRLVLAPERERVNRARKWYVVRYDADGITRLQTLNRFPVEHADALRLQRQHCERID